MYKKSILAAACIAIAAITASAEHYKIIVPLSADEDGAMARLVNYDTSEPIDSVLVTDQSAVFEGEIDEPALARVLIDGARGPLFILESGTISFSKDDNAFGSMLNDQLRSLNNSLKSIVAEYHNASTDAQREAAYNKYNAALDAALEENGDNILGYYIFLNGNSSQMDAAELREVFAKYPSFKNYERSKKLLAAAEKREATQPGKKFVDFEVTYNGETKRLSDYVGKGKYTLVDFWASWCGPCIRQTAVLKDIYNKYKNDNLEVLGVAVWDRPEDTMRAIKEHELPWESIINAQTIPTDLYGITGIPCIILFGPDGTIISRDKQDDALRADVDAAMAASK